MPAHHLSGFWNGDIDFDGAITTNDYYYINYARANQTPGSPLGGLDTGLLPSGGSTSAVPEPASSFFFLGSSVLLLLRGRSRVSKSL